MNKQELENKINELEKQLTELKEELNKPESNVWKPKCGDAYHYILSSGAIVEETWQNGGADCFRYSIGNCFKTLEEAKFEVERLKVIAELKRFANEHNEPLDWNDVHWTDTHKNKYCIAFHAEDRIIYYDYAVFIKRNDIYFSSEEIAKQAVAEIGEERLKKYYFKIVE